MMYLRLSMSVIILLANCENSIAENATVDSSTIKADHAEPTITTVTSICTVCSCAGSAADSVMFSSIKSGPILDNVLSEAFSSWKLRKFMGCSIIMRK